MLNVVNASEMREMDRKTIEDLGIPGVLLMENAGLGVVDAVEEMVESIAEGLILVICGKGNNGGDGYVAARHLLNHGYPVEVVLLGDASDVRGDAKINLEILGSMGNPVRSITTIRQLPRLSRITLIVDAILGTGISGDVKGLAKNCIEWINQTGKPVLSIDVPSGLDSDTGRFGNVCVQADHTVTMAQLKRGLVLPPGRELAGSVSIADISMPRRIGYEASINTFLLEHDDIAERLPARPRASHKGDFGKVFILAGSRGMTGAASLSALASLRAGCGLAVLGIPESLNPILEAKCTEVMTQPLPETADGTLSLAAESTIEESIAWADIVAIGPGLSANEETSSLVRNIVRKLKKPVVMDADGINAFEAEPGLLTGAAGPRILTPHIGELARVSGFTIEEISQDPIEIARRTAKSWNSVLVLKGSPTIIAEPSGTVFLNPTGNSGMATAGSGDVLTGIISGLLAQRISASDAALCGVFCHGLAGDEACARRGNRSTMAGDLLELLPEVFREFEAHS